MSKWFKITNASANEAQIDILDYVGQTWDGSGVSAKDFIAELDAVTAKTIVCRINSPGGQAFEGLAIYNALKQHPATVVCQIQGLAASIASVIAMAGDEIHMASNAFMMIHDASGLVMGTAKDMRKAATALSKMDGKIAATYSARGNKTTAEYAALMTDETWLTAEEAQALGLVDVIDGESEQAPMAVAACVNRYRNVPESLKTLAASVAAVKPKVEVTNVAKNEETVAEDAEDQTTQDAEDTTETADDSADAATDTATNAAKPATIDELETISTDAKFVLACAKASLTIAQAKAMLAAQPAPKAQAKPGGKGITERPSNQAVNNAGDWMSQVKAYKAQNKCSFRDAASAVTNAHPELHASWVKAQGQTKMTPIQNGSAN